MTEHLPNETLSLTIFQYTSSHSVDYRIRIGEALCKTIQRSGLAFVKHGQEFIHAICNVLYDPECKASAVALISVIAEVAPLTLLGCIQQIWDYVHGVLIFERDVKEMARG